MNTSASSDGTSGSSSWEMQASALCNKQWSTLNLVGMHLMTLQNLVRSHGERNNVQQPGSPEGNENMETGSSSSLSDISCYIEQIRQEVNEEKSSLPLTPSGLLAWNRANLNQDASADVNAVVERALNNSVVLRTVMSNLNAGDLLRCRLVSKSWKEEATIQILSTSRWKDGGISFSWDDRKQKYTNKIGTLEELTERYFSVPRRKFPCLEFMFDLKSDCTESEEPSADLTNFFSNHGHLIKKLCLCSSINSAAALRIMSKIVFEWTPNLKSLTLEFPCCAEEPPTENDEPPLFAPVSLNYLQELHLENYSNALASIVLERSKRLVTHVLSSAPNLKRVSDRDLCFTQEISASGKVKATDNANVYAFPMMASRFIEFSRVRPQLTHLEFDVEEFVSEPDQIPVSEFFSGLQIVLESSRSALKTLKLSRRLHFNYDDFESVDMVAEYQEAQFVFPIMENLEKLTLEMWFPFEGGEGWILPVGFPFQHVLPRLKRLNFKYMMYDDEGDNSELCRADNPFANHFNSSTTVEILKISPGPNSHFGLEWINQSRVLYPNVRVLHIKIVKDWTELPQLCRSIWTWWKTSSLEELKITVRPSNPFPAQNYLNNFAETMDQALTGFNKRTCQILRQRRGSRSRRSDRFTRGPSILDMSKLKLFDLAYYSFAGSPLVSRVSVIHAFEPMRQRQNLRVRIGGAELDEIILERNKEFPPLIFI